MAILLRLSKSEEELIRRYAEMHDTAVSHGVAILEKTEDEFDLQKTQWSWGKTT